jgi:hypothetical protein
MPTPTKLQPPFPRNVPLLKGALVSVDRTNSQNKTTVPFQYNPKQLTRTLKPNSYGNKQRGTGTVRYAGAPEQTIGCEVELEAVGNEKTGDKGLLAYLAALELLLYPTSDEIESYRTDVNSAKRQAGSPLSPRLLFVWGPRRVLPVQLTEMKVTEILFNDRLSPIMAKVSLTMRLDGFSDIDGPDYQLQLAHLKILEKLRDRQAADVLASNGRKTTGAGY